MNIKDLREEYQKQDNRATAYPIYVTVQELVSIGVIADGYSVNCPYGDGETRTEKRYEPDENEVDVEDVQVGYIWVDREWFLTIKGAEEYVKANRHNHGKLRTYVHHFERRNFEMRELLKGLHFKIRD